MTLLSMVRVQSLKSLQVPEVDLTSTGGLLLDLRSPRAADRALRLHRVLFARESGERVRARHIAYGVCRLLAGLGLAGELGAGITLVSELLPRARRGLGTTVVASLGLSGADRRGAAIDARELGVELDYLE